MSGNRLADSYKSLLDVQSEMSMFYGGKESKRRLQVYKKRAGTGKVKFKMLY